MIQSGYATTNTLQEPDQRARVVFGGREESDADQFDPDRHAVSGGRHAVSGGRHAVSGGSFEFDYLRVWHLEPLKELDSFRVTFGLCNAAVVHLI